MRLLLGPSCSFASSPQSEEVFAHAPIANLVTRLSSHEDNVCVRRSFWLLSASALQMWQMPRTMRSSRLAGATIDISFDQALPPGLRKLRHNDHVDYLHNGRNLPSPTIPWASGLA